MFLTPRLLLRRAAALLASLALLAVPARGVLACDMDGALTTVTALGVAGVTGGSDAHAHHRAEAAHMTASPETDRVPEGGNPEAPTVPQCDHLVGCAPIAFSACALLVAAESEVAAPELPSDARAVTAPVRALEPPPPKR